MVFHNVLKKIIYSSNADLQYGNQPACFVQAVVRDSIQAADTCKRILVSGPWNRKSTVCYKNNKINFIHLQSQCFICFKIKGFWCLYYNSATLDGKAVKTDRLKTK